MTTECWCDRCMGYGPRCWEGGEHNYGNVETNANCKDCGEVNGPLLSYIGRISKMAKRCAVPYREAERLLMLRYFARIAVAPKNLSERETFATLSADDLP